MSTWNNSEGESRDSYKLNLMVKSCRFDSTLCAVLNRWNLRVASTLQHRRRSYSILQSINQKFVVGQIIGKRSFAIFGRRSNDRVADVMLFVKILIKRRRNQYIFLCKLHINYMYCRIWYLTNMFFLISPNLSDNRSISIYNIFPRN